MTDAGDHQAYIRQLRSTLQSRDYLGAKLTCNAYSAAHQHLKEIQLSELDRMQQSERLRLRSAKRIAIERARSAGHEVIAKVESTMTRRQETMQASHDDKLQVFSMLQKEKENHRPVVYSTVTNALRNSEKHLAKLHMFDEAHIAKQKLLQREAAEAARALKERERKVREVVEIKKDQYLDEERTLYTRMKGELQVQKNVCEAEVKRVLTTFDHVQKDMDRAHFRQKMQCLRTTSVDLETALASGAGQQSRAQRGSTMLRKIKGNRFTIPSLCDAYGSLLDNNDNNTNNSNKSYHLPARPQTSSN